MTRQQQREKREQAKQEKARAAYYADPLALPPEADALCLLRPCYNKYENKGSYSTGRGYTSSYSTFKPACATCMNQGCPSNRGKPDEELSVHKAAKVLAWAITNDKTKHRVVREIALLKLSAD